MNLTWTPSGGISGNSILQGDGFFISYMPPGGLSSIRLFDSDGSGAETALVIPRSGSKGKYDYLILNGDWRREYEQLVPQGLAVCRAFYDKHKGDAKSSWSTDDRWEEQS